MSYAPKRLVLVPDKIKRGDTIYAWPFSLTGVPSPEDAIVTFSLHLENLNTAPLIELDSDTGGAITTEVNAGVLSGTIPDVNMPAVGKLLWEVQVRVPTVAVAGPTNAKWNRTVFEGSITVVQDGAERTLP